MTHSRVSWLMLALALIPWSSLHAQTNPVPASITVPAGVDLRQQRHTYLLQVLGASADGYSLDLSSEAKFTSADGRIATVDALGVVRPVTSGQTTVTITVAGQTKTVPVKVQLPAVESATSFRHEVMPVLSRAGCNSGACHGYSLGKNGFKLSLRGADPEQDYVSIVREYSSRRISVLAPEASMLVAKPRGDAPHEGGARFAKGSLSDDILVRWIREGAPGDLQDTNQVVAVRLVPDKLVLKPGQKHRLQFLAEYSDGSTRDVTRLGVLSANNNQYADIDDDAIVTAGDTGETAIVGRFERTFAATSVMVVKPEAKFALAPVPQDHLVDRHIVDKLNRLKLTASAPAGDEEFLRRVHIDLIGIQPKPEEIKAFLADKNPKKRETTIEGLFKRPEFVDHWSLKWGDLLQNSRTSVSSPSVYQFREFLRGVVASNMRMDEFARKVLTSKGGIHDDPASVYFAISKDTNDTVERVTQVFCGVRMLCARCHAHPLENWTQADYYGLGSFFSQMSTRVDGRFPQGQNNKFVQLNLGTGSVVNPRTGKVQAPKFLGGAEPKLPAEGDRREVYAKWLTAADNPFFARGLVNRFWSYFFHRGIIEPVDDIRSTNPPINPALLDALTKDFIDSKFDVRQLMRRIVTSAAYQRSSVPNATNKFDEQNFSRAIPRRVPAESLLDSLVQATGMPENFGGVPAGFRAAQLPDANVDNDFLKLFGKSQRMEACECERDNSSNMLQALHFLNGKSILGRVQNPASRPAQLLKGKLTDADIVTELYLWSLARHPSGEEMRVSLAFMQSYGMNKLDAAQDLFWALLNSRDFLLVH